MPVFSNSRLGAYEQCPLKYKYQYIDKIKVEEAKTVEAFMGSCVHETLEKLYRDLKLQKRNTQEDLLKFYNDLWAKNWSDDIKIVRKEYTADNYRKTGEKCIADYYNKYAPFKERVLGIETEEYVNLDPEGEFKWNVRMDRLDYAGDGKYEIHDYKTAGYLPKQEQADEDRQLALYSLWVKENFRDAENVELVWHYLAFDREVRSERTAEQLENLREETLQAVKKVVSAKEFPANESNLCNWCEYKNICPKWAHLFKVEALPPKEFKEEDGVRLVDALAVLSEQKKELDTQIEAVKDDLIAYARNLGVEVVFGSNKKATVSIRKDIAFPAKNTEEREALIQLLKAEGLWGEVEDLDIFALKKIVQSREWDEDVLNKLVKYQEEKTSATVRLGKLNKEE
ncbi:MAG TPA: PD-(D/E)XK nuclease family protein [Smithellaceae bacterium]|jgi:putative RecB family exonuclease|nr:PD-(D/E)XK nuclease family protein [Smithellaceae bacterium]